MGAAERRCWWLKRRRRGEEGWEGGMGRGWQHLKPLLMKTSAQPAYGSYLSHRRGTRQKLASWRKWIAQAAQKNCQTYTCQCGEEKNIHCLWTHNYLTAAGMLVVSWWHCTANQMCRAKLKKTADWLCLFDGYVCFWAVYFILSLSCVVWQTQ